MVKWQVHSDREPDVGLAATALWRPTPPRATGGPFPLATALTRRRVKQVLCGKLAF